MSTATGHFIFQRVSAAMLLVLGLWFVFALSSLESMQLAVVAAFIARPLNGVLLALLCTTMAYHSYLGVQIVIDDYVHSSGLNPIALLASRAAHLLLALVSVYAIYRIGSGA